MKFKMFLGQLKIEMKLFLRDRQAVFWTFFFPVFLVLLFGYIFGRPNAVRFGLGLVDEDQTSRSEELVAALEDFPVLTIDKGSRQEILGKLNKNDRNIAVIINKGYGEAVSRGDGRIDVLYDQSQQQSSQVVLMILQQLVDRLNQQILNVKAPIKIVEQPMNPQIRDTRYIDFLLPGVIGMSVVSTCLFSIGLVVVAYREKGKLRRLSVTPLPKSIFIAGQMVNRYLIVLGQATMLILIGLVVFDVQMVGRPLDFLLALTIGMIAFIAVGFSIASVAKTTETASGIANTLFLPMMFLSGVYFPIDGMPKFLKPLVEFLPLTHLIRAIRSIFVSGVSFADVLPQMLILSIWIVACFSLSVKLFKWEA